MKERGAFSIVEIFTDLALPSAQPTPLDHFDFLNSDFILHLNYCKKLRLLFGHI